MAASALESTSAHERLSPKTVKQSRQAPTWLWGALLAALLGGVYLLVAPPSGDLAAATYRSDLFARAGLTVWDDGWYLGHALPAYSLLAPALGALLGVRVLLALCAVVASTLFGLISPRALPRSAARAATVVFAFGFCAELPSGRVPYDLGVALALAATLAMTVAAWPVTVVLAVATSAASPVAGAFLALAGVAVALATRLSGQARMRDGLLAAAAALATIMLLALLFPEGGYEPFAASAFWPELAAAVAIAALLPAGALSILGRRTVRIGACLYAVALTASFLIQTPAGSNVTRLGAMFGAPIVVGVLWSGTGVSLGRRANAQRLLLLLLAPLLLYWQLATAIDDQVALAGDPTVHSSFYAPLRAELLRLSRGAGGQGAGGNPIRVEVPMTNAHWESVYLPGGSISIARGWERQLDTRYDALFYGGRLSMSAYRHWLNENAIAYVALPAAKLDSAGQEEKHLIEGGLPYLAQVWHSSRWRLFAVHNATPLVQAPAQMLQIGTDSFTLQAPRPGSYEVRLHWTPYWALASPAAGCVSAASGGFTEVQARRAGTIRVEIQFALDRVFSHSPRCVN
ncbi:MAG TPA: hypothetical protein VGP17_04880 [Solirubrobacteraceae bacterium]|nr:hypothetical protein [Solirubrobacteraceae bacterium]